MLTIQPSESKHPVSQFTIDMIMILACSTYGVSMTQLVSRENRRRTKEVAWARQLAALMLKNHVGLKFKVIGSMLGYRSHCTPLKSYELMKQLSKLDKSIKEQVMIVNAILETTKIKTA